MSEYGGASVFTHNPSKVDAFIVRVDTNGEITNFNALKRWMNNEGYLRWNVYTNSEGGKVFRVVNTDSLVVEFRTLLDMDVLYYSLDEEGKRKNADLAVLWDFGTHFLAEYK